MVKIAVGKSRQNNKKCALYMQRKVHIRNKSNNKYTKVNGRLIYWWACGFKPC